MKTVTIHRKINETHTNSICVSSMPYQRVVVIGGGFAGLSLIEGLKNKKVQVVLLDKNNYHQFQPLLYQVATSGLEPDSIAFPYRKQISDYKNVNFRMAEVQNVDTRDKIVYTDKGSLNYDYLVIASGTVTNFFGMKDIQKNSIGLKTLRDALNIRHSLLHHMEQAAITCSNVERKSLTGFVIVGGGSAGIELAGALAEFKKYIIPKDYPEYDASIVNIYLIEAGDKLIPSMSDKASEKAFKYLRDLDVNILLNESVISYDGTTLTTQTNKKIQTKNLFWTAGVKGQIPDGIDEKFVVKGNRLHTNSFLQIIGLEDVFAIGDIASIKTKEKPNGDPQVAQTAIQQGKLLAENILNIIRNKPLKKFKYKDRGSLATVGKRKAVADIGKLRFGGYFAWLLWSFVHLMSISGFRNKLLVGINWMISYFSYEKSNRLIIKK